MIAEPKWFYCDEEAPKLSKKRKMPSQPGFGDLQCKAQKKGLTTQPMDTRTDDLEGHMYTGGEVEYAEDSLHVDAPEDEDAMDVDSPESLILGVEVRGLRADTDETHLETLRRNELEVPEVRGTLLARSPNAPQRIEGPANEADVGQGDELRGVVSEETIKAFIGGKKAKVGTKRKDIDDYLKLFINAHRLPRNTHCRHVHLNSFFCNHSGYLFHYPCLIAYLFFSGAQRTKRLLCKV